MIERIDDLFLGLATNLPFPIGDLKDVVKNILIFSQGNAGVELGFSLNELKLETNMKEQSLVAKRVLYKGVSRKVVFRRWNMFFNMKQSWKFAQNS